MTSPLVQALVDTSHRLHRSCDLAHEDGLVKGGLRGQLAGVEQPSGGGQDLSSTSVDGVGVQLAVDDVDSEASHVLVGEDTVLGGTLEGSDHGVLDFGHVLDGLGHIDQQVRAGVVSSEAPDLEGIILLPLELLNESLGPALNVILWSDFSLFDGFLESFNHVLAVGEDSVVLVLGLDEALLAGFGSDGLLIGDDWVALDDIALGVVLLQIVEADFDVELTAAGNDVLTGLLNGADDQRVGL